MVSDFSSSVYWTNRFQKERSFEWLANTKSIGPIVLELVKEIIGERSKRGYQLDHRETRERSKAQVGPVNILHFGCGTSSLGPDLAHLLRTEGIHAEVVDADYVADSIRTETGSEFVTHAGNTRDGNGGLDFNNARSGMLRLNLDVLDPGQLAVTAPEGGWDLLIDKSTADAISCGPSIRSGRTRYQAGQGETAHKAVAETTGGGGTGTAAVGRGYEGEEQGREGEGCAGDGDAWEEGSLVEPIHILCNNLARVTRPGGKWLCISYSSTRFDHLKLTSTSSTSVSPPLKSSFPALTSGSSPSNAGLDSREADTRAAWHLIDARPIEGAFTGEPAVTASEAHGKGRVVYAPETNVWAYVLERI